MRKETDQCKQQPSTRIVSLQVFCFVSQDPLRLVTAMATSSAHNQLAEAMQLAQRLSLRMEALHREMCVTVEEWRSNQAKILELCHNIQSSEKFIQPIDLDPTQLDEPSEEEPVEAQCAPHPLDDTFPTDEFEEDYAPDPEEVAILRQVMTTEMEETEDSLTQPAENTQASQERLLLPQNRLRLGKRFSRSQMAALSTKRSQYDASFDPRMSTEDLYKEILADLERIPDKEWETSSRQNVRPTGQTRSFQKTCGLVVTAHWRGIPMPTTDTYCFRNLTMKSLEYAKRLGFDLHATTIQWTKDFMAKPHDDKNNKGPSGIIGFGHWTGGATFVEDENGTDTYTHQEEIAGIGRRGDVLKGFKLDIHKLQKFNGKKIHCTMEFQGRRYALVLFSLGRSYEQTPALARAFLQKLGFPLPPADFQAPMHPDLERLAERATRGMQVEDEAGRHAPPAGRKSRARSASNASRAQPKRPRSASLEEWTAEKVKTLRVMKEDKKSKYSWKVVAQRLKMTVDACKEKWTAIRV